ncbi:hypothetical protein [Spirillospora sp. NPDC029432]|uniref:hypothetical protein n=1 Tax=Spirillospora sp. NPDC029432 TaxID=3154599 RepID=UPI0034566471
MPQQRLKRLGSATAVSAGGALVLVALSAPPAAAAGRAAAPCPKGTDPASTIDNWKCQLDNIREGLEPKKPATPAPSPTKTAKPPKKETGSKPAPSKRRPKAPERNGRGNGPPRSTGRTRSPARRGFE